MNWYRFYDIKRSYWLNQWKKVNTKQAYDQAVAKHDYYLHLLCGGIFNESI